MNRKNKKIDSKILYLLNYLSIKQNMFSKIFYKIMGLGIGTIIVYNISSIILARIKPEWLSYHNYFGIQGKKIMYNWLECKSVSYQVFKKLSRGEKLLLLMHGGEKNIDSIIDLTNGSESPYPITESYHRYYCEKGMGFTNEKMEDRRWHMDNDWEHKSLHQHRTDYKMGYIKPKGDIKIYGYGQYATQYFKTKKICDPQDHIWIIYNSEKIIERRLLDLFKFLDHSKETIAKKKDSVRKWSCDKSENNVLDLLVAVDPLSLSILSKYDYNKVSPEQKKYFIDNYPDHPSTPKVQEELDNIVWCQDCGEHDCYCYR